MTLKQLLKILRRFPRKAAVKVQGNEDFTIAATQDQSGQWTIHISLPNNH